MRAGALRHIVAADEPVTIPDGAGGRVVTWVERLRFAASIEPIGGREVLRANQVTATMDTRFVLRWSLAASAIRATWRLRHAGVLYDIVRPPAERFLDRRELEILALSGLTRG